MKLRTNIYLEEAQAAALDEAAHDRGISRAELIRQLIDRGIGTESPADLDADLAAIDASYAALGDGSAFQPIMRGADARSRYLQKLAARESIDRDPRRQ